MSRRRHTAPLAGLMIGALTLAGSQSGAGAAPADAAGPSPDQSELTQTAHVVAGLIQAGRGCQLSYAVDLRRLDEVARSMYTEAWYKFGRQRFVQAAKAAKSEVADEVRASGTAAWCRAQRDRYDRLGFHGLIGDPLP